MHVAGDSVSLVSLRDSHSATVVHCSQNKTLDEGVTPVHTGHRGSIIKVIL